MRHVCERLEDCTDPTPEEQCAEQCYYFEAGEMQYFRVAGDRCYGGEKWENLVKSKDCPEKWRTPNCRPRVDPSKPHHQSGTPGTNGEAPVHSPETGGGIGAGKVVLRAAVASARHLGRERDE